MKKLKNIAQVILLILIMIVSIFILGNSDISAASNSIEVFDDTANRNWDGVPQPYSDVYFFCRQRGGTISISATSAYGAAYDAGKTSSTYSDTTLYKYYKRSNSGLIYSWSSKYNSFIKTLKGLVNHSCGQSNTIKDYSSYSGDDQNTIDAIEANLAIGKSNALTSIVYTKGSVLDSASNQDALYVLTAMMSQYGGYSEEQAQWALWELGINIGTTENTNNDSGLGDEAELFQTFYNAIHSNGSDVFASKVKAVATQNGNKTGTVTKETTKLNGTSYDTYVYDNTTVEVDTSNNSYILRTI